jgi:N-methylhydantoinase A/oxoprolinase/acetone carboxylase beta subunit
VIARLEEALSDDIQYLTQLFHGSTAATNCLLQRNNVPHSSLEAARRQAGRTEHWRLWRSVRA